MTTFHAIPGVARVVVFGFNNVTNRPVLMTYHAKCPIGATVAQLHDIANVFVVDNTAEVAFFPSTYTMQEVEATDLSTSTGNQAIVAFAANTVGTGGAGDCAVSAVVEFKTATRGRSFRGKVYLPVPDNKVSTSSGSIDSSWLSSMVTLQADHKTALQALSPASDLVVGSIKAGVGTVITSFVGRVVAGYIRRRLIG